MGYSSIRKKLGEQFNYPYHHRKALEEGKAKDKLSHQGKRFIFCIERSLKN